MREFDFITQCLKPLVEDRALDDDTSLAIGGQRLVVNTDTIIEGRHYLPSDPPDTIAKKLLRVNISDLASTGATPCHVSLALTLGSSVGEGWLLSFAQGLAEDLANWEMRLIGGDTTRTDGPSVLTATMIGDLHSRTAMRRWHARAGDGIWLGRALGAGGLGLADAKAGHQSLMADHYRMPHPQLDLGLRISALGQRIACADVSDGLGADLGHIAQASGVRLDLDPNAVPVEPGGDMNAGDDYALVAVTDADLSALGMTAIGRAVVGQPGVWYRDQEISQFGYEHR